MSRQLTVKKQVLLYVVLPILVVFAALQLLDFFEGREQAIKIAKKGALEKSEALANRVDTLVIRSSTVAATTAVALTSNTAWSEKNLYEILKRNVSGNPLIYGAAIAFDPGVFPGRRLFSPYVYRSGDAIKTIDIAQESYDYTRPEWEWYALPKLLNKPVWTAPYFDKGAGNIQMVTFSVPFYHDGQFAGITTIDLDLSRLPQLADIPLEKNANSFILSDTGIFVYHPDAAWLGRTIAENQEGLNSATYSKMMAAMGKHGPVLEEVQLHDERRAWLSLAPIKTTGWNFVVQVDEKGELAGVEAALYKMIVRAGVALAIAMAALIVFIDHILGPITRLAHAAKEVAEGKPFSFSMPFSGNEVSFLARNMAVMTESLQEREQKLTLLNDELEQAKQRLENANEDLERRVDQRTTELQSALASLQESSSRFRFMLETSPIAVRIARKEGREVIFANQRYRELVNSAPAEIIGLNPQNFYANKTDYEEILDSLSRNENVFDRLVELVVPGFGIKWALASYLSIEYEGEPAVLGWFYDITARKQMEEGMQLAAMVYESSSEAITVTDEANRIVAINPAFTQMTGYAPEEVLGLNPKVLSSGRQGAEFYENMWSSLHKTGQWSGEIWNRRKSGEEFVEWLNINTIFNEDGSVHRRVAMFSDITEKKRVDSLIWNQANFDHLTQLPNRRLFYDRLEQEIRKSHRDNVLTALMFIDLDRFKEVNDTLGHHVGDSLLIEAAQRIKHCVRDYDTLARIGGDEFTVILSELNDASDAARVAKNIIDNLSEPFLLQGHEAFVSASIGIAMYPEDAQTVSDLTKHADQAMYVAKQEGRKRFHFFTSALQQSAELRMRLASDLRSALRTGQFEVFYQPIVSFESGRITKAEALLRWKHPQHGYVSPAAFIPIAEDTGTIHEIGDWVFMQAAEQVQKWRSQFDSFLQISVNKSPAQFTGDDAKHDHWIQKLSGLGLSGEAIVIEITEGLLMSTESSITGKLLRFRDAGIQVAIDDFGTGYSSLAYLKKFDIDFLKIDQSFIRNLTGRDTPDFALCEAMVVMAHKLGLKIIAEGIETALQHDLLKTMGCDYGQGYLFSRPVCADDFEKLLRSF